MTDLDLDAIRSRQADPYNCGHPRDREDIRVLLVELFQQSEKIDELIAECDDFEGQLGDLRASLSASEAEVDRLTGELSGAELAVHTVRTTEVLAQRENAIAQRGWREVEAERDAMRPVVEAAVDWRGKRGRDTGAADYIAATKRLCAAVDAYERAANARAVVEIAGESTR